MTRRLIFNGFSMNVVSHIYHGLWRHPGSRQIEFNSLEYWVDVVKTFERGKFDNFFVADVIGVDAIYKGSWDTFVEEAVQIPVNDASTLIGKPAIAQACRAALRPVLDGSSARAGGESRTTLPGCWCCR